MKIKVWLYRRLYLVHHTVSILIGLLFYEFEYLRLCLDA